MFSGCDFWTDAEESRGAGLPILHIPPFEDAVEIAALRTCHVHSRSSLTEKSRGSVQAERARGGLSGLCPTFEYVYFVVPAENYNRQKCSKHRGKDTHSLKTFSFGARLHQEMM
jgi:hypothetical protein